MAKPVGAGPVDPFERRGTPFAGRCPSCKADATMHPGSGSGSGEVALYLAVPLWDSAEHAVQCGACLTIFEGEDADAIRGMPVAAIASTRAPFRA